MQPKINATICLHRASLMVTDLNSPESEPGSTFLLTYDRTKTEISNVKEVEVVPEREHGGAEIF